MPILGSIIKRTLEFRAKNPIESIRKPDGFKTQKKVLKKLLKKAQFTAFGEHYEFEKILRNDNVVKTFQEKVPIFEYNSIAREWWYRSLNGEAFVTWPGIVKHFALSSGTSDATSKYIPVTADMIKAIRRTTVKQLVSLSNYNFPKEFYQKGILMLGGSTHLHFNGTYYAGDLSGINTAKIPFWFQHHYKPGKRISKERDWETKLEEIIKMAPSWDIGSIVGVPAWFQILLERIIKRYNLKNIHDIWPNLKVFCHGGVAFGPYVKSFEKLLDKPLVYIETYLASEGFIAYQCRPNSNSMTMVLDNGLFYEFVPFNSENFNSNGDLISNPKTLTINQIEENKEYALLISTCAGAWRYLLGDTLIFTSKKYNEIIITGRTKHFLNLCGEHLSLVNMNRAIEMLEDELNIEVREFTVTGIKYDSMFAHKWYIGTDNEVDAEIIKEKIDKNLMKLNDDYRVERIAAIRDVFIEIVPTKAFYDWMKIKGKVSAQGKFPRVLKNEQHNEWKEFLDNY
ncbi:MAG: GH3 auxin-responsive promoter family protein [Saprospiraceae bacterium]|nr:GH3 auxin-responsive promoter family protein [Saprospiraceae bacterium]